MNTIGELLAAKGIHIMTTERKAEAAKLTSPPIKMIIMDEADNIPVSTYEEIRRRLNG